jgi:Domain of unknown function (DUF4124)
MEVGIMKKLLRRMSPAIAALVAAAVMLSAGTAAQAQTMYKYLGPDGKTVYSDSPPPAGVKYEKIQPRTAPTGVDLNTRSAAAGEAEASARARDAALTEKKLRIANLQKAYDDAKAALEAGKEPQAGERESNVNTTATSTRKPGGQVSTTTSHLTDDYFARVEQLQQKMDRAKAELDAAQNE